MSEKPAEQGPKVKRMQVHRHPPLMSETPNRKEEKEEGAEEEPAEEHEEMVPADSDEIYLLRTVDYHPSGNILLNIEYDFDGEEVEKYENAVDANGRVTEHRHYVGEDLVERTGMVYDEAGRITEERRYYGEDDDDPAITFYVYDAKGQLLEKRVEISPGEIEQRDVYEYHPDFEEVVTLHKAFGVDDKPTRITHFNYELREGKPVLTGTSIENKEAGTKYRTEHLDAKTHEENVAVIVYDSNDRVSEVVREWYNEQEKQTKVVQKTRNPGSDPMFEYEYDERGNQVKTVQYIGGQLWSELRKRYDENNLLVWQSTNDTTRGHYVEVFTYELY